MKATSQKSIQQKSSVKPAELAWHYTTGENFYLIVESGVLLPTDILLDPGESPVLWFSKNQIWEPTSRKMTLLRDGSYRVLSKRETAQYGRGLVRFGYPSSSLLDWSILPTMANICNDKVRALEKVGREQGADPSHWMGSVSEIAVQDVVIEVMDKNRKWKRVQTPKRYSNRQVA